MNCQEQIDTADRLKKTGNDHYKKKAYLEALAHYDEAILFKKNYKELWFNKGMCHKQLEQIPLAKEAFKQALKLDPLYEKAQYQIKLLELPAHIIFAIADIKFTSDAKVKILEFGRGIMSGFTGHDCLYPDEPIMKKLENTLINTLKIPILYNGMPGMDYIDDKNLPLFLKLIHSSNEAINPSNKLSDYKGIYLGRETQKVNADVLVMDNSPAWHVVSENKYLTDMLFKNSKLTDYRPRCETYPLRYEKDLAENIKKSMPGTKYVLKAPDLCGGAGVFVVNADELDDTLKLLLSENEGLLKEVFNKIAVKLLISNHSKTEVIFKQNLLADQIQKWRATGSKLFLVEEYCSSKPLEVINKKYDPTMRVVFIVTVDQRKAKFIPLSCYWKLPKNPLGEGTLRDQTVSYINTQKNNVCSAKVSVSDQKIVYGQLNKCMPEFFLNMLLWDMPKIIEQIRNLPEKNNQMQADILLLSYLYGLIKFNLSVEALDLIKEIKNKTSVYYHVKGSAYAKEHNHEKAIQKFTKCINQNPLSQLGFFNRAQSYIETNNTQNALSDLQKAKELGLDERKIEVELDRATNIFGKK